VARGGGGEQSGRVPALHRSKGRRGGGRDGGRAGDVNRGGSPEPGPEGLGGSHGGRPRRGGGHGAHEGRGGGLRQLGAALALRADAGAAEVPQGLQPHQQRVLEAGLQRQGQGDAR
jgi:hypothetical protein